MQRKNLRFVQGVDFDLIENLPKNGNMYMFIFDDSCVKILNSRQFVKISTAGRHIIHQTQLVSSKKIEKRCRITKYTHSFFQVTEICLTNQYIKSTIRSRISIERVV